MFPIDFYQDHLDRVSRSFAFCIRQLQAPMREWVSLSYLMCRILDTVEDAPWSTAQARDAAFNGFDRLITAGADKSHLQAWTQDFPQDLPEGERLLLDDSAKLFAALDGLDEAPRLIIQQTVRTMSQGMQHYAAERAVDGSLRLKDVVEVNRYCYFVAGIVGQLLTQLFLLQRTDGAPRQRLMKNAFHFGLLLQKVNILKDQQKDEADGRFLVPDRRAVQASVRDNLLGSIEYLTALPHDALDYRTFCAWSLFMGMASLECGSKLSRAATGELIARVALIADDNEALRSELTVHLERLPTLERAAPKDWFCALSGDVLAPSELSDLRVF